MTQFQEVPTSKWIPVDMVNTRITKTSLFDEKQEDALMGLGESSQEGDSSCLTVVLRQIWGHPKGYPYAYGCTIYRVPVMTFTVLSLLHAPSTGGSI